MKSKWINWSLLDKTDLEENKNETKNNFKSDFNRNIMFHIFGNTFEFDYCGVKIIKTENTNKFIRALYNEEGKSLISMDNIRLRDNNIFIISPLTRINDLLNTKTSGAVAEYLRNDNCEDNKRIENEISNIYVEKGEDLKAITEIDLTKATLLNFLDIKDEFVSENNIENILSILKTTTKKLIIFNDVEYLPLGFCEKWLKYFDFLYIFNSFERNYERIKDWEDLTLIYKNEKIEEINYKNVN